MQNDKQNVLKSSVKKIQFHQIANMGQRSTLVYLISEHDVTSE